MHGSDSCSSCTTPRGARLRVRELRLELDPRRLTLQLHGRRVDCPPRHRRLLAHLLCNPGRVVTKGELLDCAWAGIHVCEGSVHEAVCGLRKRLARVDPERRAIETVRGRGYRFGLEVVRDPEPGV